MSRLSPMDLAFFITESTASPKHVGGALLFKKPGKASKDWLEKQVAHLRKQDAPGAPFDQLIDFSAFTAPSWRNTDHFDINQHLFFKQPETPLSEAELFDYMATLHQPQLDRSKPLWEYHIIDNVEGNRFAVYTKMHHACADGITMSRWMIESLSTKPTKQPIKALWAYDFTRARSGNKANNDLFKRLIGNTRQWVQISRGISKLVAQLTLEQIGLTRNAVALPFKAEEETPLTGKVSSERQFTTAEVDMARVNALRKATRCTLNHIALTCIDGALRRYLEEHDIVLDRPLSIQMPVNLRDENDTISGNKIGIVLVDMAPNTATDPYTRLREIGFTLRAVRNQIDSVPAAAVSQYTVVLAVLLELMQYIKLDEILPAVADTLVSNVPGPREPLYMGQARLEKMIPISTLPPGSQLNITLYSYAGTLHFGLVATEKVTQLGRLSSFIEDAFSELEEAVYGPIEAA